MRAWGRGVNKGCMRALWLHMCLVPACAPCAQPPRLHHHALSAPDASSLRAPCIAVHRLLLLIPLCALTCPAGWPICTPGCMPHTSATQSAGEGYLDKAGVACKPAAGAARGWAVHGTAGLASAPQHHAYVQLQLTLPLLHRRATACRQHEFGRERDLDPKLAATY